MALSQLLVFQPNQTEESVSIEIIDDNNNERNENFTATIVEVPMAREVMSIIVNPMVTITIADDDCKD